MFTGIIQEIGTVVRVARKDGVMRLAIQAPKTASRVQPLDSVAVSGTCLSVVQAGRGILTFEVIEETRGRTSAGSLRPGDRVNLEPSLSLADRLGGHVVFGHVDGTGTIVRRITERDGELALTIRVAPGIRRYLVPKGPVAVDGISLTVGPRLTRSTFTVHLIPETLRHTTLREAAIGHLVNIESDYFAKLIRQFVRNGKKH
jgi:riboflavin synthase